MTSKRDLCPDCVQSRRTFLKGAAAAGAAATGIAAGGSAAGQEGPPDDVLIVRRATAVASGGLINIAIAGVNLDLIDDVTVTISGNTVNILSFNNFDDLIEIDINNVLNENIVVVNLLSGGTVVRTRRIRIQR